MSEEIKNTPEEIEAVKAEDLEDTVEKENDAEAVTEDFNADISGVRILLVEDNELNAEIAEFILTENGAKVETVKNGLEAVQHFEASEPAS